MVAGSDAGQAPVFRNHLTAVRLGPVSDDALTEPVPSAVPGREALAAAMRDANLPTLVAVLFQLTGDPRWLADPYRPTRSRGMEDNDSGGFPPQVQDEIRAAAVDAVLDWAAGRAPAVPAPTGDDLVALMSLAVGEEVGAEYEPMTAADMGFRDAPPRRVDTDLRVVVIGAGVSGMLAAIKLREAGIEPVVLEKNLDVGGTWLENTYPGAGVDTPSHLYSYSFAPRQWSTHFGKRDEVLGYLRSVADAHGLRRTVRFGVEVASAHQHDQGWTVTTTAGEVLEADVVITAVGQLNRPKVPDLPGLAEFRGPLFHSARWPEDLDVTGKRVAVVGTGASAMQIVPAIAGRAGRVTVFQRSAQWAAPNDVYFSEVAEGARLLLAHVPFYRRWYRTRLSWNTGDRVHPALQVDPAWEHPERSVNAVNDGHRRVFTRYLQSELDGREDLLERALPDYPPFGKRMLLDNGWFAALRRDDVDLVSQPVAAVTATGLRAADGTEVEADVIVLCTGFETTRQLWPMDVRGRDGAVLADIWGPDDADAHLGITVAGFPNLFLTCGPGTVLGHGGSYITIAECQVRWIVDAITTMAERGYGTVEVTPEAHADYAARHDAAHEAMIWTHPGMRNWYRNPAGRVVCAMPWRIVDYWRMTREVDWSQMVVEPRRSRAHAPGLPTPGG
ncbi:NAD(P)/FAD-dependent oxidoreductase [Pseudonocardia sp. KRD-184]|uniref:NAD(P)/FAD-dependent oxidoreductase n=1 Tax=Pseudonocardia oceani TaxID=2792013 RepID=A0ABS6U592_9PSEU|nr:NAD(P)/FAD-dependent oxidoreductase [Pseudonocardia oceani]MBW0099388.1 NAD(P)/FAD-dependent oxidoreductase [Pseudonocardia oceani]MBW0125474.1 NAD(P)/FAD-dependent oxidoreductase [Pseudonocardia oceani]MBW0127166.1 NAD(P)/FAD-dependent oxidoreductase [Pseudonocardia oceani]